MASQMAAGAACAAPGQEVQVCVVAQQRWARRVTGGFTCVGVLTEPCAARGGAVATAREENVAPVVLHDTVKERAALGHFGPQIKDSPWTALGAAAVSTKCVATCSAATVALSAVAGRATGGRSWSATALFHRTNTTMDLSPAVQRAMMAARAECGVPDSALLDVSASAVGETAAGDVLFAAIVGSSSRALFTRQFAIVVDARSGRSAHTRIRALGAGAPVAIAVGPGRGQIHIVCAVLAPPVAPAGTAANAPTLEAALSSFTEMSLDALETERSMVRTLRRCVTLLATELIADVAPNGRWGLGARTTRLWQSGSFLPEVVASAAPAAAAGTANSPADDAAVVAQGEGRDPRWRALVGFVEPGASDAVAVVVPQASVSLVVTATLSSPAVNAAATVVAGLTHPRAVAGIPRLRSTDPGTAFVAIADTAGRLFVVERFGSPLRVVVAHAAAWGVRGGVGKEAIYRGARASSGDATGMADRVSGGAARQINQVTLLRDEMLTASQREQRVITLHAAGPGRLLLCDGLAGALLRVTLSSGAATAGVPSTTLALLPRIRLHTGAAQLPVALLAQLLDRLTGRPATEDGDATAAHVVALRGFAALCSALRASPSPQAAAAALRMAVQRILRAASSEPNSATDSAKRRTWELHLGLLMWLREQLRWACGSRHHALDAAIIAHAMAFHRAVLAAAAPPGEGADRSAAMSAVSTQSVFDARTAALVASHAVANVGEEVRALATVQHSNSRIASLDAPSVQQLVDVTTGGSTTELAAFVNELLRTAVTTSQLASGSWVVVVRPEYAQECRVAAFALISRIFRLPIFVGCSFDSNVLRCATSARATRCNVTWCLAPKRPETSSRPSEAFQRLAVVACDLFAALGMVELALFTALAPRRFHAAQTILELLAHKLKGAEPCGAVGAVAVARLADAVHHTLHHRTKLDTLRLLVDECADDGAPSLRPTVVCLAAFLQDPSMRAVVAPMVARFVPTLTAKLAASLCIHTATIGLLNRMNEAAQVAFATAVPRTVAQPHVNAVQALWMAVAPLVNPASVAAHYEGWHRPGAPATAMSADALDCQLTAYLRVLAFAHFTIRGVADTKAALAPLRKAAAMPSSNESDSDRPARVDGAVVAVQRALMLYLSCRNTVLGCSALQSLVLDAAAALATLFDTLTTEGRELARSFLAAVVALADVRKSEEAAISRQLHALDTTVAVACGGGNGLGAAVDATPSSVGDSTLRGVLEVAERLKTLGAVPRERFVTPPAPLLWESAVAAGAPVGLPDLGISTAGKHALENPDWFAQRWPAEYTAEYWSSLTELVQALAEAPPQPGGDDAAEPPADPRVAAAPPLRLALFAAVCTIAPPERLHSIIAANGAAGAAQRHRALQQESKETQAAAEVAVAAASPARARARDDVAGVVGGDGGDPPTLQLREDGTADVAALLTRPLEAVPIGGASPTRAAPHERRRHTGPPLERQDGPLLEPLSAADLRLLRASGATVGASGSGLGVTLSTLTIPPTPSGAAPPQPGSPAPPVAPATVAPPSATNTAPTAEIGGDGGAGGCAPPADAAFTEADVAWWEGAIRDEHEAATLADIGGTYRALRSDGDKHDVTTTTSDTATSYSRSESGNGGATHRRCHQHTDAKRCRERHQHCGHHHRPKHGCRHAQSHHHLHGHRCDRHRAAIDSESAPAAHAAAAPGGPLQAAAQLLRLGGPPAPPNHDGGAAAGSPLVSPPGQVPGGALPRAQHGAPMQPLLLRVDGSPAEPQPQPLLRFSSGGSSAQPRVTLFRFDGPGAAALAGEARGLPPVPPQGIGLSPPVAPPSAVSLGPPQHLALSAPPQVPGTAGSAAPGAATSAAEEHRIRGEERQRRREERRQRKNRVPTAVVATAGGNEGTTIPQQQPQQQRQQQQEDTNRLYGSLREAPLPAGVAVRRDGATGEARLGVDAAVMVPPAACVRSGIEGGGSGGGGSGGGSGVAKEVLTPQEHSAFQRYLDDLLARNASTAMQPLPRSATLPDLPLVSNEGRAALHGGTATGSGVDAQAFYEALARQQALLMRQQEQLASVTEELRRSGQPPASQGPAAAPLPYSTRSGAGLDSSLRMSASASVPRRDDGVGLSAVQQAQLLREAMEQRHKLMDMNERLLEAQAAAHRPRSGVPNAVDGAPSASQSFRSAAQVARDELDRSSRSAATSPQRTGRAAPALADAATQGMWQGPTALATAGAQTSLRGSQILAGLPTPTVATAGAQTSPLRAGGSAARDGEIDRDGAAMAAARASLAELEAMQQRIFSANDAADAMERAVAASQATLAGQQALFAATVATSENEAAMNTMKRRAATLEHELRSSAANDPSRRAGHQDGILSLMQPPPSLAPQHLHHREPLSASAAGPPATSSAAKSSSPPPPPLPSWGAVEPTPSATADAAFLSVHEVRDVPPAPVERGNWAFTTTGDVHPHPPFEPTSSYSEARGRERQARTVTFHEVPRAASPDASAARGRYASPADISRLLGLAAPTTPFAGPAKQQRSAPPPAQLADVTNVGSVRHQPSVARARTPPVAPAKRRCADDDGGRFVMYRDAPKHPHHAADHRKPRAHNRRPPTAPTPTVGVSDQPPRASSRDGGGVDGQDHTWELRARRHESSVREIKESERRMLEAHTQRRIDALNRVFATGHLTPPPVPHGHIHSNQVTPTKC